MSPNCKTVLLVDNDDGFISAVSTRLKYAGYSCLTALTGAQGISICRECEIDAIITDLNMPAGDGLTLVRFVRKNWSIPIIVVTGFEAEYHRDLSEIENVEVLGKPFDFEALLELLETEIELLGADAGSVASNKRGRWS